MSSQRSSSYDSPFFILCNITSVEIDKNTFLVSPFYGLCLWQIPADASSPFLRQAFGTSRENEPSPSVSHYGKTKYGDKIAPCGRKKSLVRNCLEDSTIRNPVHTRETRMCGGYSANPHYCLEGSTPPIRYSLPGY